MIPAGEGVSAILKARQDHYYRIRNGAGLLFTELHANQPNMKVDIFACSEGVMWREMR